MDETSQALQRIVRGTGIVFAGTIISMFFGFLSRALIARYFSVGEYGVYNLAITILSVALVIVTLGFPTSLPREIAVYREKEPSKVKTLISTALMTVVLTSAIWTMVLVIGAEDLARIFGDKRLVYAVEVTALALPFSALTGVIISVTQGFGRVREKVYFQNIIYPILWLVFVLFIVAFNLHFTSIFWAYVLAQSLTFFILFFDVFRTEIFGIGPYLDRNIGRELIKFSVPLMLTGIAGFVMTWMDTLMLGYYKSSEAVGLYSAATPLARLLPIFLNSTAFLYPSIISRLYAHEKLNEMKRAYQVLTKWIFLLTLPLFSIMMLFPAATIAFFFGPKYISASQALQILALGFMFHTFVGLNGLSLVVIGESRFIMVSNTLSSALNLILNALLIPLYGMAGAATATAVSYIAGNVLISLKLYRETGIHPFSRNYVKLLAISFVLLLLIQSLNLSVPNIWYAIPILLSFLTVYGFLVLLSKSVDREDIELMLAIEKRLGIDLGTIKKILRRFV